MPRRVGSRAPPLAERWKSASGLCAVEVVREFKVMKWSRPDRPGRVRMGKERKVEVGAGRSRRGRGQGSAGGGGV